MKKILLILVSLLLLAGLGYYFYNINNGTTSTGSRDTGPVVKPPVVDKTGNPPSANKIFVSSYDGETIEINDVTKTADNVSESFHIIKETDTFSIGSYERG